MPGYAERNQRQDVEYNASTPKRQGHEPRQEATLNWSPNPPPAYEATESTQQTRPARREWDNVSARIAARTAGTRHTSKRYSRGETSNRVQKGSPRKHKPGLSIDTTVTRHIGATPQQLQPKGLRFRTSGGYRKIDDGPQPKAVKTTARSSVNPTPGAQAQQQALPPFDPSTFGISLVSHFSPETPTIVITPAFDGASLRPGGRAASSLYSRATFAPSFVDHGTPPPLPTNAPYFQGQSQPTRIANDMDKSRDSVATDFEEELDEKTTSHARATSSATLFEEDNTPLTAPIKNEKSGRNLYIDTTVPPTPRRSRGWWNVITTPFESASRFLRSPTDGSRTPDVPPLPSTLFPAKIAERGNALSPDSATRAPLSRSRSQKQSQEQKVVLNFFGDRAAVDASIKGPEELNARATHNSQALRRLESHERLPSEPVPPLPPQQSKAVRESELSPNDREVPIVFNFNPTVIVQQPQNLFQPQSNDAQQPAGLGMTMSPQKPKGLQASPEPEQSPQSGATEFSPAGQIAGIGTVLSSKAVISNGAEPVPGAQVKGTHAHSLSLTSRSSMTAEIIKQPYNKSPERSYKPEEFQTPYYTSSQPASQSPVPQPRQNNLTFLPPPRFSSQPPARFSEFTAVTEKPKRKKLTFTLCARKKKNKHLKKSKDLEKNKDSKKKKKKRVWCCCCLCFLLLLLVGAAIALAVILSRRHNGANNTQTGGTAGKGGMSGKGGTSTQKPTFVTVSNFPPVPTGDLTIARPNLRTSVSGCVNPKAMWSCAVPKEQQNAILPNDPDQPNFVLTINVDNSSISSTRRARRNAASGTRLASSWVKRVLLQERDIPMFTPSPAPPTLEEQSFIGRTTDGNTAPFEGETTPFFISFKPPVQGIATKAKRQDPDTSADPSSTSSVNQVPNIATAIPIPDVNPDGTAQPANLLPFPVYQPLRLYNRGTADEHYGFYTYFERNIFLKSIQIQNSTQQMMGDIPSDLNGGAAFAGATARCSWRDTRFKVQIWTNKGNNAQLLPSAGSSPGTSGSATQSFIRPGTFPYPVTISLDRHGGGLTTKMLFCYGMDARGHIDINSRKFQPEMRDFAGHLDNPALGPFKSVNVTAAQGGPGGIDGGSGGCECEWANWLSK